MDSCQILKIHGHLLEPKGSPAIDHMLKAFQDAPRPSAYSALLALYGDRLPQEPVALHKSWFGPEKGGDHIKHFADGQVRPFSDVAAFLSQQVYGRDKMAHVPDPKFIIGALSAADIKTLSRFISGMDHRHSTVRISGRSIKHADEQRHDAFAKVVGKLPSIIAMPGEVLHNPSRDNSAFIVYEAEDNYLLVLEIAKNGNGTDVVNVITTRDRGLRKHRQNSSEWLEGRQTPHPQTPGGVSAGGDISVVHPLGADTIPNHGDKATKSFENQFDLLKSHIDAYLSKSYVAAHMRTTADGRVIQVRGFSNSRGRDVHTPDLFRQHLAAPKMKFTPEQARNPELFTPDLFSGETKASRPKRFQVRDSSGAVVKVFHGETAEHEARQHISQNQGKRLSVRNVTFDD